MTVDKPSSINILGVVYGVEYCDNPSGVDIYKRSSLWGQIDFWTRSIRIYDRDRPVEDVLETLLHEVIHGLAEGLKISSLQGEEKDKHDDLSILSMGLMDTLVRNGWIKINDEV